MVFEDEDWNLQEAWRRLAHDHDDFVTFMNTEQLANDQHLISEVWTSPSSGKLKLNTNGSWRQGDNLIGGGGLLCGSDGSWIYGFWSCGRGDNAFMAELEALRDGLRMAWNQGCRGYHSRN